MARPRPVTFDKLKIVAENRRARFDYHVEDVYEAGLMLQGTEVKALREENAQLREDMDEADEWAKIVDTTPLDQFDELGERWVNRVPIIRLRQAIASVFVKYAPEPIMERFRQSMGEIMHQSFVEGAMTGVRSERARSKGQQP